MACIYPARTTQYVASDFECPYNPSFFCPQYYQCYNISNGIPACTSESFSCTNTSFCYEYINGLEYTSDNLAKQLELSYSTAWVIIYYTITSGTILALAISMVLIVIFQNSISWTPMSDDEALPVIGL